MKKAEPATFAQYLRLAMLDKSMKIGDIASSADFSYEHLRKIFNGEAVPSKQTLHIVVKVAGLDLKKAERLATNDKIRAKYGKTIAEVANKNPELGPIEAAWPLLSREQKQTVTQLVQTMARQSTQSKKI
jgi:DNA-binding phage protein